MNPGCLDGWDVRRVTGHDQCVPHCYKTLKQKWGKVFANAFSTDRRCIATNDRDGPSPRSTQYSQRGVTLKYAVGWSLAPVAVQTRLLGHCPKKLLRLPMPTAIGAHTPIMYDAMLTSSTMKGIRPSLIRCKDPASQGSQHDPQLPISHTIGMCMADVGR